MSAVERLIAAAEAEIGYLEKATNAQLDHKTANAGKNNWTKYARDLDGMGHIYNGRKNGYDWCDVFVDWCFITTFGKELGMALLCQAWDGLGAGTGYSANYYKQKGQYHTEDPQPGDQIFFGDAKSTWHTGIVAAVDKAYVYTIEGNTSGASGVVPNGGGVAKKRYKLGSGCIKGYGRPDWSLTEQEETDMEKEKTGDNPSEWAREATEWCKAKGIFNGDGEGNYKWQEPMTREAAAQVIYNIFELLGKL